MARHTLHASAPPPPSPCRHCGNAFRYVQARGLCWRCHRDPQIRARYPAKGANGDTADEQRCWHVVGTRHDGSQCVIESHTDEATADRRARLLAPHLESYRVLRVERAGQRQGREYPVGVQG